ncbi:MAG TPA: hypothetical protein VFU93_15380 [Acidimicrobiales bacterium]|nr:hypothetical protein [Acidimicrobiales bacterium]
MSFLRRWWPVPASIGASLVLQQVAYTGRYDVGGHASEHLGSGSFVFLATAVSGLLLWLAPAARRSPIVVVGLAAWLAAGVAIAIGNVRVVEALIDSGQAATSTDLLQETTVISDAHDLANTAPLYAVVAAMAATFGLQHVGAISRRLAVVAAVLNVLIPYWLVPGFGVVVATVAVGIRRERTARAAPPAVTTALAP